MNMPLVTALVTKHEGYRCVVYIDTRGRRTIGIGFNLDDRLAVDVCRIFALDWNALVDGTATLTLPQAEAIRDFFIAGARQAALRVIPGFDSLPDNVQAVVVDMLFEMGEPVFAGFHATIGAINNGDYKGAASQMKQSAWYGQVPSRAQEDCQLMQTA
jgi:lysozyme